MALSTDRNLQLILPTEDDAVLAQVSYQKLVSYLQQKEANLTLKIMQDDTNGETVTIPAEAFRLLVEILAQMEQGNAVKLPHVLNSDNIEF
jgi:hypothetical protein